MKTTPSLLAAVAAAILAGCGTTSPHRDFTGLPATDITVSVTCSEPGMGFTGTIVSDGHAEEFSGTGSGTFHASGHEFVCSFQKTGEDGRISLAASESGGNSGSASSTRKHGGVRAEFLLTPEKHDVFTGF